MLLYLWSGYIENAFNTPKLPSELSLACLECAQNTTIGQKQLALQYTAEYQLFTLMIEWLTGSCGSLHHESTIMHIPKQWYDFDFESFDSERSKFKIWSTVSTECVSLLHHCNVKKKKKIKSGTVCEIKICHKNHLGTEEMLQVAHHDLCCFRKVVFYCCHYIFYCAWAFVSALDRCIPLVMFGLWALFLCRQEKAIYLPFLAFVVVSTRPCLWSRFILYK